MLKKLINLLFKKENNIYFIGNAETLPPPLSKSEEREYILKSRCNDKLARDKLIEHNLRLVVFLAKKYSNNYDLEDLVSIGTIGLIKGIETYKLDKNIRLATYASRCITNEILMYIRKNKNRCKEISFEDALNHDSEGNKLTLEDVIGTSENYVHDNIKDKFDKEQLTKEISTMPKRDKEIITYRYGLGQTKEYTQKEVATMLGISQSYISRIEKKVIKKLKNIMN